MFDWVRVVADRKFLTSWSLKQHWKHEVSFFLHMLPVGRALNVLKKCFSDSDVSICVRCVLSCVQLEHEDNGKSVEFERRVEVLASSCLCVPGSMRGDRCAGK